MKTKLLCLTALLSLTAAAARADLVMISETDVSGIKSRTTMSIKDTKVRTDNGTQSSVIIDTVSGDMTTLMHENKMIMTVRGADLKAAAASMPKPTEKTAVPEIPVPVATGKTETVLGYACEIYTLELSGSKTTMWIAKDYPGYDKLQKELTGLKSLSHSGAKQPELPGMAVKTEMTVNGLKYVTTIVSLTEAPVDAAVFTPPSGYKAPGE